MMAIIIMESVGACMESLEWVHNRGPERSRVTSWSYIVHTDKM